MRLIASAAGRPKAPSHFVTKLGSCAAFATAQRHRQHRILLPAVATQWMGLIV